MTHTFCPDRVKARKEYKCNWCGEPIVKGEVHLHHHWIYDGEFNHCREHIECSPAYNEWMRVNDMWDEHIEPYQGIRGKPQSRED